MKIFYKLNKICPEVRESVSASSVEFIEHVQHQMEKNRSADDAECKLKEMSTYEPSWASHT